MPSREKMLKISVLEPFGKHYKSNNNWTISTETLKLLFVLPSFFTWQCCAPAVAASVQYAGLRNVDCWISFFRRLLFLLYLHGKLINYYYSIQLTAHRTCTGFDDTLQSIVYNQNSITSTVKLCLCAGFFSFFFFFSFHFI